MISKVALMTKREMKKELTSVELIKTADLQPYEFLYFTFDKSGEFDDEMYSGDEPKTNEEMQLILKGQKPQFTLFTFTNQILKNIQTFNYTKAFELVNKCSLCFKVNKYYWATNFTALENSGLCG